MISRRHIRIKVMQSLYSYFSQKESSISSCEKEMLNHIENINELHNVVLSLLLETFKYAENYFEDNKKKFLPSSEDLNPNTKFTDNFIIYQFYGTFLLFVDPKSLFISYIYNY